MRRFQGGLGDRCVGAVVGRGDELAERLGRHIAIGRFSQKIRVTLGAVEIPGPAVERQIAPQAGDELVGVGGVDADPRADDIVDGVLEGPRSRRIRPRAQQGLEGRRHRVGRIVRHDRAPELDGRRGQGLGGHLLPGIVALQIGGDVIVYPVVGGAEHAPARGGRRQVGVGGGVAEGSGVLDLQAGIVAEGPVIAGRRHPVRPDA